MTYDQWKLATPPEYEITPEEEAAMDAERGSIEDINKRIVLCRHSVMSAARMLADHISEFGAVFEDDEERLERSLRAYHNAVASLLSLSPLRAHEASPSQPAAVGEALTIVIDVASTTAAVHRGEGRTVLADQIDAALETLGRADAVVINDNQPGTI